MLSLDLCPRGTKNGYAVAHKCDTLLLLSLFSQYPALPDVCLSQPKLTKPVLRAERYCCLCPLLDQLHLPAVYIDPGHLDQCENYTEGMRQLPSERQSLVRPLQRLARIAQQP